MPSPACGSKAVSFKESTKSDDEDQEITIEHWLHDSLIGVSTVPRKRRRSDGPSSVFRFSVQVNQKTGEGLGGGGQLVGILCDYPGLPQRLVLKAVGGGARVGVEPGTDLARAFTREVNFFQMLSHTSKDNSRTVCLAAPQCFLATNNPPPMDLCRALGQGEMDLQRSRCSTSYGFSLIFEDLRADGFCTPSMSRGLTVTEASSVLRELAQLHAAFWPRGKEGLEKGSPCVAMTTDQLAAKHSNCCSPFALDAFSTHYGSCLGDACTVADLKAFDAAATQVLRCGPRSLFCRVCERAGCVSLVHGDVHPLNIMLRSAAEGVDQSVRLVDFADVAWTCPSYDIQQCLACCLPVDERRQHEQTLLTQYYEELRRHCDKPGGTEVNGVLDWQYQRFVESVHCLAVLSCLQIAAFFGEQRSSSESHAAGSGNADLLDSIAVPLAPRLVSMVADCWPALSKFCEATSENHV